MKIAVLYNLYNDSNDAYLMYHFCKHWKEQGHQVDYIIGLGNPLPPADVLFMHVDSTVIPPEFTEAAKNYPVVINRRITDISKSKLSKILVNRDDNYPKPVIVKTDNNSGGIPEVRYKVMAGEIGRDEILPSAWDNMIHLRKYPIFETAKHVPAGVWQNKNLIVEKFLPERGVDGKFHAREWIFLGDQELHFINIASDPIVKGPVTEKREYLPPGSVPAELQALRKQMRFDYGKFDYGINNGKPILYDINKTPAAPADLSGRPGAVDRVMQLSRGIESYIMKKAG